VGDALQRHWPEYLMEAAGLGLFMVSVEASFFPSSAAVNPGLPSWPLRVADHLRERLN
jgi:hypothetical protein